jgi:para-nitrobenzyl esterase
VEVTFSLGPFVETATGTVRGARQDGVCSFRGIPYARPPVGAHRFRAPQPAEPWTGERDATGIPASAPQNPGILWRMVGHADERQDEDCLYLNVWTPAADTARRPVLVWIHGGGFTIGSGTLPVYDGSHLARRGDVVVVTINYRLGALGWLALPELAERGDVVLNAGLRDQVAALEWVRSHIHAFGGDPGRVTLFGESAGAMSVGTLLAVPRAHGLFQGAILQSGAAHNVHRPEGAARVTEAFCQELGVSPEDAGALRRASAEELLSAQQRCMVRLGGGLRGLTFQPVVDGDLLPRPPIEAARSGEDAAVPALVGTNLDEWRIFGLGDPALRSLDRGGLLRRLASRLPGAGEQTRRERAEAVVRCYEASRPGASPADLWLAIESDRWFRRPAAELAEARKSPERRTHAYLFTWPSPAADGALGSCHALEIPFVFGTTGTGVMPRLVGSGEAVTTLSERMQDAWLAFARDGAPGTDALGDWPSYERHSRATMRLGAECELEEAPLEAERRIWDGMV